AESAGTHPASRVHPLAVSTAARAGLDLSHAVPRTLDAVHIEPAIVVTVCDRAHEELSTGAFDDFPGAAVVHWSVPDPVATGSPRAFREAFETLRLRIARVARPRTREERR